VINGDTVQEAEKLLSGMTRGEKAQLLQWVARLYTFDSDFPEQAHRIHTTIGRQKIQKAPGRILGNGRNPMKQEE
jgi:hypothetical protein